jgi:hypothetical protein
MPAIKCKCGNKINYGEIPNPNELLVISDVEYDEFSGSIDSEKLYKRMKSILQCNKCNRLFYFRNGLENEPIVYAPDV